MNASSQKSAIRVAVCVAHGCEEMEVINIVDVLRRANFYVVMASSDSEGALALKGSRNITFMADVRLADIADEEFDCVVLPGGLAGAECFRDSPLTVAFTEQHKHDGKLVAAICAAPVVVLQHHNLFPEALMTSHPSLWSHIPTKQLRHRRVTFDQNWNLLTSQGPGTSQEFALDMITLLAGKEAAAHVAEAMVVWPNMNYGQDSNYRK